MAPKGKKQKQMWVSYASFCLYKRPGSETTCKNRKTNREGSIEMTAPPSKKTSDKWLGEYTLKVGAVLESYRSF